MANITYVGGIVEGKRAYKSEAKEGVNKGVITDRLSITVRCDDNHDAHKTQSSLFTFQVTSDDAGYAKLMALEIGMNVYMAVQATERNGFTNVVVEEVELTETPEYAYPEVQKLDTATSIGSMLGGLAAATLPGATQTTAA